MWKTLSKIIEYLNTEISELNPNYQDTRKDAKDRLRLVLMHDRTQIAPGVMEKMRMELIEVLSRYVEVDEATIDLHLQHESNSTALVANIPILSTKKSAIAS